MVDKVQIENLGNALHEALLNRETVEPLTERFPDIEIPDAYQISLHMLNRRVDAGERVVGKKIGVTSKAVMDMLNVHQPDFGYLTDRMMYSTGAEVPVSVEMIQPRAEGEIAFVLKDDLTGPRVTAADVIAATDFVLPCFEIVDSRIKDWKIKIEDTIADNASCGAVVLGDNATKLTDVDLETCGLVMELNGEIISTGAGAAALGSPINSVIWLANTLGELGVRLEKGEVILSGSLVPLQAVTAGDNMYMRIGGIGECSVRFI